MADSSLIQVRHVLGACQALLDGLFGYRACHRLVDFFIEWARHKLTRWGHIGDGLRGGQVHLVGDVATRWLVLVYRRAREGSAAILRHTSATPMV